MALIDYVTCEPLRVWSRLEPRAREIEFDGALAAKIHDPLWMLARQWQFGEFKGEDTGSAIFATIARQVTPVDSVRTGTGPLRTERGALPIESRVERLPIEFPPLLRAQLGRTFLLRLAEAAVAQPPAGPAFDMGRYRTAFRRAFPIDAPPLDPADLSAVARARTNGVAERARAALTGRAVDGVALFAALRSPMTAGDLPAGLAADIVPEHLSLVLGALDGYRAWFTSLYTLPPDPSDVGWEGAQLEYQAVARVPRTGGTVEITVDEHVTDRLDWYAFDQGPTLPDGATGSIPDIRSVIPSPLEFAGMPNPRWWQFEDAAVDLGSFRADATDIAKIVVAEFALLYGNNWFVVPVQQPIGTLAEVEGVVVTDVFGVRTLVKAATGSAGAAWTSWDLFSLSPRGTGGPIAPLPQHLFVPSTVAQSFDGAPLETVALVRDESADMVWGIEVRVPDGIGGSRDGTETARRFRQALSRLLPPAPVRAPDAPPLRYTLGTEVPESWIPFIPVHRPEGTRLIRLQRAAMPRLLPDGARPVRPTTSILRQGLRDDETQAAPYFVNEEEVSPAGVVIRGGFRRARWLDGATCVWHARTVGTGRGETDSGLRFDVVERVDPRP
jgi:hypothetical protein